jgi:hypothetical protein
MTISIKKIIPWILVVFGLATFLLIALVLIAPTLVNLEAVKREVETTISRAVGGTVTTEHVGLSVLPRPTIVLSEPRISIPGSVEGRMHSLDVQIRLLPLLRRTIQVNSIELNQPRFTFYYNPEARPTRQKEPKQITVRSIEEILAAFTAKTAGLTTAIDTGRIEIREKNRSLLVIRDLDVTIRVPTDQSRPETISGSEESIAQFVIDGNIDGAIVESPELPGPVSMRLDEFTATAAAFTFQNAAIKMLDGSITASGTLSHYLAPSRTIEVTGNGRVDARIVEWIRTRAGMPIEPVLRTPIEARNVRLVIKPESRASLAADLQITGGPAIAFKVDVRPDQLELKKCAISDTESQASIGLLLKHQEAEVSFQGMLSRGTLDRLVLGEQTADHRIRGDFRARLDREAPYLKSFDGTVEAENLLIPVTKGMPLEVLHASANGEGNKVRITSAKLRWAEVPVEGQGTIMLQPDSLNLDLDAHAGAIDINAISQSLAKAQNVQSAAQPADDQRLIPFPMHGTIRAEADSVSWNNFTFLPVRSSIAISPESVMFHQAEASFCGIVLTGDMEFRTKKFSLALDAEAEGIAVEETLRCLNTKDHSLTGSLNLSAQLSGAGLYRDVTAELNGPFEITAVNGNIKRLSGLAMMLDLINSTEVFRGKYPGFGQEGLNYNSISLKGDIGQSVLTIREGVMDGTTMEIAAEGAVGLENGNLDLRVAVAPLKTVDVVVKRLPVVKDILGGTLIAVPFRVTGTVNKPEVKSITLAEAGKEVTGIFSRTFKAPFKFVEGLVPRGKSGR